WTAARVGGASLPSSASTRRPGFFRAEADLDRVEAHRRWVKFQTQPWVVRVRRPHAVPGLGALGVPDPIPSSVWLKYSTTFRFGVAQAVAPDQHSDAPQGVGAVRRSEKPEQNFGKHSSGRALRLRHAAAGGDAGAVLITRWASSKPRLVDLRSLPGPEGRP